MHRRRLSELSAATSGLQPDSPLWMNSTMRDVYAGPTCNPLPWTGTMSSRIAFRLDFLASSTMKPFGSGTMSGLAGTSFSGTLKKAATRSGSARSHASSSLTATRKAHQTRRDWQPPHYGIWSTRCILVEIEEYYLMAKSRRMVISGYPRDHV